jgi:hypothetical protein
MSNIKSKLAASVRQVKAQAPAKPAPAKKPPPKTHQSPAPKTAVSEPQASGSVLFPSRVWPD